MKKKKLIISGDSWTDENFKSDINISHVKDYPSWPSVLNKKYFNNKFDVVNTARCGYGNDYIISQAIKSISKDPENVGLVIIGLSEYGRFNIGRHRECLPARVFNIIKTYPDKTNMDDIITNDLDKFIIDFYTATNADKESIGIVTDSILSRLFSFQTVCKKYNIPYVIVPLLSQFEIIFRKYCALKTNTVNIWTPANIGKELTNNDLFYLIDEDAVIGWPFIDSFGGFVIDDILDIKTCRVGNGDMHPNKLGHERIAELIYEFINEKEINRNWR